MNKHTEGKWEIGGRISGQGLSIRITGKYGTPVIASVGDHDLRISEGHLNRQRHDWKPDEIDANARLIAAAPEMLEALKRIEKIACVISCDGRMDAVLDITKSTIAKATKAKAENKEV